LAWHFFSNQLLRNHLRFTREWHAIKCARSALRDSNRKTRFALACFRRYDGDQIHPLSGAVSCPRTPAHRFQHEYIGTGHLLLVKEGSGALQGDLTGWLNQAVHGGALFRSGEHAKALAALSELIERHGKPRPLTHNLLALTHLQMGELDSALAKAEAKP
jgi:hypothetical protein